MIVDEETYLEHYGVKGMKWGQRRRAQFDAARANRKEKRYTNPDGTPMNKRQIDKKKLERNKKVVAGVTYGSLGALVVASIISENKRQRANAPLSPKKRVKAEALIQKNYALKMSRVNAKAKDNSPEMVELAKALFKKGYLDDMAKLK